ncbi:MAG: hypothetical protein KGD70_15665 [Candidatus Lokiarchaeota archaeon]|nr:hypothetical protein [Candidatus Lokiarchaeota archaeon]
MEHAILENEKVANWLDECRTPNTRHAYSYRILDFFTWYNDTPEKFLELNPNKKRHVVLRYQNEKRQTLSQNTLNMTMGCINSFLDVYDQKINFKGKRVRTTIDISSHIYSNGDLNKIFALGNTKEKAFLALMTSTGWEIGAVLELKRKTVQEYINRAKEQKTPFYFFMSQRKKTGALRLGCLNPLALKWVERWLIESEDLKLRSLRPHRNRAKDKSDLLNLGASGCNALLKRLTSESQIKKTGRIHSHSLRKWVMGNLIAGGFNEFEVKFFVGKNIPSSDFTYLKSLEIGIAEKYPKVYQARFNLETSTQSILSLTKSLEEKDQELKSQKIQLEQLQKKYDNLHLEKLLDRLQQLEKKLQKVKQ